jgi:hypothetical protein
MLDQLEYSTHTNTYQGNGNGYEELEGDWALYYKVGKGFAHRVKPEDREDFLHDLFLAFARVRAGYDAKGKELSKGGLVRIAQYELADYWHRWFKRFNGTDCAHCSREQKAWCKRDNLYSECPKAVKMESLDRLVDDGNGDSTPLHEFIADDSGDFVPRLEAKLTLNSYPRRFVQLALKRYAGYRLTDSEAHYYYRELKKAQKRLLEVS